MKSEWRIALISSGAALLGALIGGGISYVGGIEDRHAEQNAALLAKRQADYAEYLAAATKLQAIEYSLRDYFENYDAEKVDEIQHWADRYYETKDEAVRTDYVVALICSPQVDAARLAIVDVQNSIDADLHALADDSAQGQQLAPQTVESFSSAVEQLPSLHQDFATVARETDLKPPPR